MEGRRVTRRAPKRNPLYVLFLCLVAAVFILLIVTIVLGAKLGSANKQLEVAQQQIEELEEKFSEVQEEQKEEAPEQNLPSAGSPVVTPEQVPEQKPEQKPESSTTTQKKVTVGWLDLTGHNEVAVLPDSVFNEYYTYYTTDGVNLRAGPSTSHNRITLVDKATKVKAAAKDGEWTFVSVGNKFGWINSNYLSTTQPGTEAPAAAEATSGSLKTQ